MASLRPEGALNVSKGLIEIGRVEDALDALHQVLSNRRYRQWNATMEKIAEEYVRLCLQLGKPRYAKDGLIQFRNVCQPNNLQSLDAILKLFRSLAEEKVRSTRGKLTTGADGLVDLDETESGEALLLSALSNEPAVVDERAARSALRDLWDTLRNILEVCRNHPALEETYHATAVMAFDFCSEFKRRNEFRRISETLRLHQQQSSMRSSSGMVLQGQQGNSGGAVVVVDPLVRVLETRSHQLRVASELGLWSVAFHTVEEMYQLLSKKRPTQAQLIAYYSSLAKILQMSSNPQQKQLFHAACVLKHSALVPSAAADQAVLAVLAAAVPDSLIGELMADSAAAESHENTTANELSAPGFDKSARLVTLTGTGAVPTAESLVSDLIAKDIVSSASETVKQIFALFQSKEAGVLSLKLAPLIAALPAEFGSYTLALRRAALVKVTKDMQGMYSCMPLTKFESLTGGLMPLEESIKLLGQLKRIDQIDVRIDFQSRTISFASSVSSSSASSGVSGVNCAISVITRAAAGVRSKSKEMAVEESAQNMLFDEDAFFTRLEADRRRCDARRNASDARKEAIEQEQVRKAQELADQIQRAEEERLEADARARAAEQARREREARKREDLLVKAKAIVEKMVATGASAEVSNLSDEDLIALGLQKLEQMQKDQLAKERLERISKRRNEARRLEHTARLVREAENERIAEWAKAVYQSDQKQFEEMAAEKAEEWRRAAEEKRSSVEALMPFSDLLSLWKGKRVEEFEHKLAARAEERRARAAAKAAAASRQISNDSEGVESEVAPTSTMSRDEFKEMAKSLPSWKDVEEN